MDFSNYSGCIDPALLETGDLLFVGRLDAPTFMGKPASNTPEGNQATFLELLTHIFSIEAATRNVLNLLESPSVTTQLKNHLSTVAAGYYSGHVAMVIVENSTPYIIEAGTTDYCNYRVALHPYYVANETTNTPLLQMRGWANRRYFQGDRVWLKRYKDGLNDEQKESIAHCAKSLLSRPYGVFDSIEFANDSRVYCSDFIFQCYNDAANIELDDQRTWAWFFNSPTINHLGVQWPNDFAFTNQLITWFDSAANTLNTVTDRRLDIALPALSMPMLYYSKHLSYINHHTTTPLEVKNSHGKILAYGVD
jgi:hypothetical protein